MYIWEVVFYEWIFMKAAPRVLEAGADIQQALNRKIRPTFSLENFPSSCLFKSNTPQRLSRESLIKKMLIDVFFIYLLWTSLSPELLSILRWPFFFSRPSLFSSDCNEKEKILEILQGFLGCEVANKAAIIERGEGDICKNFCRARK